MAKIKGKWLFNKVLTEEAPQIDATFTAANGQAYKGIRTEGSNIVYMSVYGYSDVVYNLISNKWLFDGNRTTDFGDVEQDISDAGYAWITANAKETPYVTVTYGDTVLATLEAGQTAQLHIANTEIKHDMFVTAPNKMKLFNLQDKTITVAENDTVEVTPDAGYDGLDKVTIRVVSLISFTIGGYEYQAEKGMTWRDWCNSQYNPICEPSPTGALFVEWEDGVVSGESFLYVTTGTESSDNVLLTDTIISSFAYAYGESAT